MQQSAVMFCIIIIIIIIITICLFNYLLTYLLELSFHYVAVVLTLLQAKQIRINMRKEAI